jgi:hypothetical protein
MPPSSRRSSRNSIFRDSHERRSAEPGIAQKLRRNVVGNIREASSIFQIVNISCQIGWLVLGPAVCTPLAWASDAAHPCGDDLLTKKAVLQTNQHFQESIIASDASALGRLLAPDFLYFTFSGEK